MYFRRQPIKLSLFVLLFMACASRSPLGAQNVEKKKESIALRIEEVVRQPLEQMFSKTSFWWGGGCVFFLFLFLYYFKPNTSVEGRPTAQTLVSDKKERSSQVSKPGNTPEPTDQRLDKNLTYIKQKLEDRNEKNPLLNNLMGILLKLLKRAKLTDLTLANRLLRLNQHRLEIKNSDLSKAYKELLERAIEKGLDDLAIGNLLCLGENYLRHEANAPFVTNCLNQLIEKRYGEAVPWCLLFLYGLEEKNILEGSVELLNKLVDRSYYDLLESYWGLCKRGKSDVLEAHLLEKQIWCCHHVLAQGFIADKGSSIYQSNPERCLNQLIESRSDYVLATLIKDKLIGEEKIKKLIEAAIDHALPQTMKQIIELYGLAYLPPKSSDRLKKFFIQLARPTEWRTVYDLYKKKDPTWHKIGGTDPLASDADPKSNQSIAHIVNLLWLNQSGKKNAYFNYPFTFAPRYKQVDAVADCLGGWVEKDPFADIYIWYDSHHVSAYALLNTQLLLRKLGPSLYLKDIRKLNTFSSTLSDNQRWQRTKPDNLPTDFGWDAFPVHFRVDWIRLAISEEQMIEQGLVIDYSIYVKFNIEPVPRLEKEPSSLLKRGLKTALCVPPKTIRFLQTYKKEIRHQSKKTNAKKQALFSFKNLQNMALIGLSFLSIQESYNDFTGNGVHMFWCGESAGRLAVTLVLDKLFQGYYNKDYDLRIKQPTVELVYTSVPTIVLLAYLQKGYMHMQYYDSDDDEQKVTDIGAIDPKDKESIFVFKQANATYDVASLGFSNEVAFVLDKTYSTALKPLNLNKTNRQELAIGKSIEAIILEGAIYVPRLELSVYAPKI